MRYFIFTVLSFVFYSVSGPAFAACTSPNAVAGTMEYFGAPENIFKFCNGDEWIDLSGGTGDSSDCAYVGEICKDGTVFAGISYDDRARFYTTPENAPSTYAWGSTGQNTAIRDCLEVNGTEPGCWSGKTNSALLGSSSYPAANYCNDLVAHGHDDWYLPSLYELRTLFAGIGAIGGFNHASHYWSSSEVGASLAWAMRPNIGENGNFRSLTKTTSALVRCVRR